ncbi:hypothetical protein FKM82_020056 [Ascaphus truei]
MGIVVWLTFLMHVTAAFRSMDITGKCLGFSITEALFSPRCLISLVLMPGAGMGIVVWLTFSMHLTAASCSMDITGKCLGFSITEALFSPCCLISLVLMSGLVYSCILNSLGLALIPTPLIPEILSCFLAMNLLIASVRDH